MTCSDQHLRKFVAPEFVFGVGARHLAGQFASNFSVRRVLMVTDHAVTDCGWARDVLDSLRQAGLECHVFADVTPNPRAQEVMAGAAVFQRQGCQAIVAVGGGSPMDCAKGIGAVCANNCSVLEFEGVDQVSAPGPPLICIPTTAGSSADVSQFAIISDPGRRVKIAIVSKAMVPDIALIDPETTTSMPADLTACTGLDALTHAVEAYVSNAHSPITDLHALEAVRLIVKHLPEAVRSPRDMEARTGMMLGSLHAGLAFSNASLGAVHAMAHGLGGLLDLPHGECNAILLSRVVEYNFHHAPQRYRDIGETMGLALNGLPEDEQRSRMVRALIELREQVGLRRDLKDLGVRPEDVRDLAGKALRDPCMVTNPRPPLETEIEELYARQ